MEHNGEDAGAVEIKAKKHCCRLPEQQRKLGKLLAEEAPPPKEEKEPKKNGGDKKNQVAQVMHSPDNIKAQPGHEAFADDRGNATEDGVPLSVLAE